MKILTVDGDERFAHFWSGKRMDLRPWSRTMRIKTSLSHLRTGGTDGRFGRRLERFTS